MPNFFHLEKLKKVQISNSFSRKAFLNSCSVLNKHVPTKMDEKKKTVFILNHSLHTVVLQVIASQLVNVT